MADKTAAILNPISQGVQAATAIAQTISNINDQNKRRKFEQALALLSNQQQQELNDKLLAANTETDRLQILSDSIVNYAIANQKTKQTKDIVVLVIGGVLMLTLLIGAFIISKKKS